MREIVQIDISGRDRPGITMGLTQVLARYDVTMLDMGQSKPVVKERARHSIATVGLDGILYLLGMRDRDLEHISN